MGTGCPPPVYVRVRRYGWRRREHAWTGGRVHRGPGAIATMMHAAARFKLISGSQVRALVRTPKRASSAPSHHSNALIRQESQSILSKIVARRLRRAAPDVPQAHNLKVRGSLGISFLPSARI